MGNKKKTLLDRISEEPTPETGCGQGDSCCQNQNVNSGQGCGDMQDDEEEYSPYNSDDDESDNQSQISIVQGSHDGPLIDIEDLGERVNENEMGDGINKSKSTDGDSANNNSDEITSNSDDFIHIHKKKKKGTIEISIPENTVFEKYKKHKEMIEEELRNTLTKQGYKLVGSHSGVKLCRWTKSMLRGQGGCYKNAFYGIASHQCMESTPN